MPRARLLFLALVTAAAGVAFYLVGSGGLPSSLLRSAKSGEDERTAAFSSLARSPHDATRWLRLGEEAQREGDPILARAAFRAAQEIAPDEGEANARLGFLLYEEGRDEEALEELRRAREKGADLELLDFTLSMMRAHVDLAGPFPRFSEGARRDENETEARDGGERQATRVETRDPGEGRVARADPPAARGERDPPPAEPDPDEGDYDDEDAYDEEEEPDEGARVAAPGPMGACEIWLERRGESGIFVVDALVNGTSARLIVDTGASLTVLSRDFLAETRLRLIEDGVLTARTAAGPERFSTAAVDSVEVGGRIARDIRVAICDECGMPGSDGLLGLDVQEPLGMSLFPGRGTVRFADCFE